MSNNEFNTTLLEILKNMNKQQEALAKQQETMNNQHKETMSALLVAVNKQTESINKLDASMNMFQEALTKQQESINSKLDTSMNMFTEAVKDMHTFFTSESEARKNDSKVGVLKSLLIRPIRRTGGSSQSSSVHSHGSSNRSPDSKDRLGLKIDTIEYYGLWASEETDKSHRKVYAMLEPIRRDKNSSVALSTQSVASSSLAADGAGAGFFATTTTTSSTSTTTTTTTINAITSAAPNASASSQLARTPLPFSKVILSHIWPSSHRNFVEDAGIEFGLPERFEIDPRNFLLLPRETEEAFDAGALLMLPHKAERGNPPSVTARTFKAAKRFPGFEDTLLSASYNDTPLYLPRASEGHIPYMRLLAWKALSSIGPHEDQDSIPPEVDLDASLNADSGKKIRTASSLLKGAGIIFHMQQSDG